MRPVNSIRPGTNLLREFIAHCRINILPQMGRHEPMNAGHFGMVARRQQTQSTQPAANVQPGIRFIQLVLRYFWMSGEREFPQPGPGDRVRGQEGGETQGR